MSAPQDPSREEDFRSAQARVGEMVLGRYRLEAVLGVGGIGVLFRGLDEESGDIVAIKTLRPAYMASRTAPSRFLREARIAMKLRHDAIPRGIATGFDHTVTPLLVMELVSGVDLAQWLHAQGPMSVVDTLRTGARVAEALAAAHAMSVVHRDIKPENIMLIEGAEIPQGVVVLDFGIAFCADEPRFTSANGLLGTPAYMSPEQARGETVTPASDLYSLGATMVELLTKTWLYEGDVHAQLRAHAAAPLPAWNARREGIPTAVVDMVNALLRKDPAKRPANAVLVSEILTQLAAWCEKRSRASTEGFALATLRSDPLPDELSARIEERHHRLHRAMRTGADAQSKLVQQLVEISARRMERARQELELATIGPAASPAAVRRVYDSLASLGSADADSAREAALESALARLQEHSLREQAELTAEIHALEQQLAEAARRE